MQWPRLALPRPILYCLSVLIRAGLLETLCCDTHTHGGFYGLRGLSIGIMILYCTNRISHRPTTTLHPNLPLTGNWAFFISQKKTNSVWLISILNYGDTEIVLINHLLLVIPMSYPCHYTNLCPHKPHKHAHTTHTHTHTHSHTHTHTHMLVFMVYGDSP